MNIFSQTAPAATQRSIQEARLVARETNAASSVVDAAAQLTGAAVSNDDRAVGFAADRAAQKKSRQHNLGSMQPNRLQRLGGLALIAAPVLLTAGMLTSPEQSGPGAGAYIESLAADPALSLWSANLLHYGWVLLALSAFATLGLLRSKRGRVFVSIATIMLTFGAIQMSGLLLSDWFLISAGNTLPIGDAVMMDAAAKEGSVEVWRLTGMVGGILGIGLLSLSLARARAISWWVAPLGFLPWIVPALGLGTLGALLSFVCYLPLLIAGTRLVSAR